jgi:hypothetical protein
MASNAEIVPKDIFEIASSISRIADFVEDLKLPAASYGECARCRDLRPLLFPIGNI